jgi:hypothetical protein
VEPKTPAENIIALLGGLTKTAGMLSTEEKRVAVSTVQGWRDRGKIPQEWWMGIIDAARENGVAIDLQMFLQLPEKAA